MVYGTKFGVVFLAEGPLTASIQKGFDCFGLYHPGLERERDFHYVEPFFGGKITNVCQIETVNNSYTVYKLKWVPTRSSLD